MPRKPTEPGLVVVSNRLPVTLKRAGGTMRAERSSGGLVTAMDPAMRQRGGTWIGWPGAQLAPGEEIDVPDAPYRLAPVTLTENEVRRYYHGFSNGTLWPLFHSFPERTTFDRKAWETYEAVNYRFALAAHEQSMPGDLVWIHDYHAMRTPHYLRQMRDDVRTAFFLHIPFPPYDIYRILPWYRELLMGVLACDVIGFHSPGYVTNFLDCVERLLGERVDREGGRVEHGERTVRCGAFPLGIDYEAFAERARLARSTFKGPERVVLGVDRLDYTKGIPERILSFERFLEKYPDHREHVVLLQVAVPSRGQVTEYQVLKRRIDELVGRVNGRFATSEWTPIRYLHRSIPPDRLAGMYRDADVALVTPLRDGMNLVAKEFVASQVEEPGVLILSRMAGAAETMEEAIRVNPYNSESVADALHQALTMSVNRRSESLRLLQRREKIHDVTRWLDDFLGAASQPQERIDPVQPEDFDRWLGRFLEGWRLAVFLDYDGTLAPIVRHPSEARMGDGARQALLDCISRRDTDVSFVSGRALDDVRKMIGLEDAVYAGNHGLEIAGPGIPPFRHADIEHYGERAADLAQNLQTIDGSGVWAEEKGASLTLHFREADPALHKTIAQQARALIQDAGFQPRDAHCAVEARPPIGWDKGHAVLHVLRTRYGPDWSEKLRVVYVGDDETDEDAFRALQGLGITFRVGGAGQPSLARRRLSDVGAVEALLRWLAQRPA
jgi:trehalose 6-phosphate synthase/phosphatase